MCLNVVTFDLFSLFVCFLLMNNVTFTMHLKYPEILFLFNHKIEFHTTNNVNISVNWFSENHKFNNLSVCSAKRTS